MQEVRKDAKNGFPLSKFNYILEFVVLLACIFLLITTFRVNSGYNDLKETTDRYIEWQRYANNMELSSDYLTRAARMYVYTGDPMHMNNYFTEASETRRRDQSLDAIREAFSTDSEIYLSLEKAMEESRKLMHREYTAMRLNAMALNADFDSLPAAVRTAALPEGVESMTAEEMRALARDYLNDEVYTGYKERIEQNVNLCLSDLIREVQILQDEATQRLDAILIQQRVWIGLFIFTALIIILVTFAQILRPLQKAIPFIRNNSTIPVSGAQEFRLLVRTYNRMYKLNQEYHERLMYWANHDSLTGVLNRRGIEDAVKSSDLQSAALMIVDVDRFKSINDAHGHGVGDRVLARVTDTLKSLFRADDLICRMGGDEFAIIMWNSGPDKRNLISAKIAQANEILRQPVDDLPGNTISVGVAFGSESPADQLFHHADIALYHTKENGRCGCTFYERD